VLGRPPRALCLLAGARDGEGPPRGRFRTWLDVLYGFGCFIRDGVIEQWQQLRAVELRLDGIAVDFGGEDPTLPKLRQEIEDTKAKLRDLQKDLRRDAGEFELPEPVEKHMKALQELFEMSVEVESR